MPRIDFSPVLSKWRSRRATDGQLTRNHAWPALRLALTVFENTLDGIPIPGLKCTVQGILVLANTEKALIQNSDDVLKLQKQIAMLTSVLTRWYGTNKLPSELEGRISAFFLGLSTISTQLHDLMSPNTFRRFFAVEHDAVKVSRLIEDIAQLLQRFQLDGMVAIEVALYGAVQCIQETVKKEKSALAIALTDAIRNTNSGNPIWSLPRAESARFNAGTRQDETDCLEGTRVDLLKQIECWINDDDEGAARIFVLQGLAGTGKSTIARTVCETIALHGTLGASFFFSRNEVSCSNPFLVFTTIAFQLACRYPQFNRCLTDILRSDPDIVGLNLETQLEKLVVEPLHGAADAIGSTPVVVVLDALDECSTYRAQMISLLCSMGSKLPVRLKMFLSLRPEHELQAALKAQDIDGDICLFELHDVDASVVRSDIERFLRCRLSKVATKYPNIIDPSLWPSTDVISVLGQKSDKLFIFAATVVKFVEEAHDNPQDQLDVVLSATFNGGPSPYNHLDQLYQQVLERALPENAHEKLLERFHMVVGAVILLYDSLSPHALGCLLHVESREVHLALLHLHSVIIVPDKENEIRLIHPSFRDFMTNRCPEGSRYFINHGHHHRQLALRCFRTMERSLKKDICDIRDMWKLNKEVGDLDDRISAFIPANLRYACRHWATHLSESLSASSFEQDVVIDALALFASVHFLHWLEVLSLIGCLGDATSALHHAQIWISKSSRASKELCELLFDGERFILEFFSPISLGALHTYHSALPFTPQSQLLRQVYHYEMDSVKVVSGLPLYWNPWLFRLYGHSSFVRCVTFSPDGRRIASGSDDKTVRIWDAVIGVHLITLKGHSDRVRSIAFTPDSSRIASGSDDKTVRIWDAMTGAHLTILKGHSGGVRSVAFSPDGSRISSGSDDNTVRIWDAMTSAHLATLKDHSDSVFSVIFSLNGSRIVSGSRDMTVRLWDAMTGAHIITFKGHSGWVWSVAFSPNGCYIASGSYDKTVRIWDARTGIHLATLKGHSELVYSVAFSPDSSCIASGSRDLTVRLWDAKAGVHLITLKGHSDSVLSVAFSPDGSRIVSGSFDSTVRIWDAKASVHLTTLGRCDSVSSVVFSPDGSRIASGSHNTTRIWDAKTGVLLTTLNGCSDSVHSLVFSPDCNRVASGSNDRNVRIWDTVTGAHLTTLDGHSDWVRSVVFSPDGSRIASGSHDETVRIWDAKTGMHLIILKGHSDLVQTVAFSADGGRIASGSYDRTVRIWDTKTSAHLITLNGHSDWVLSVAFSPDDTRIASGSHDQTVRIWDSKTSVHLTTLMGHSDWVQSVTFSPDGGQIVSGSIDHTVRIWNVMTGKCLTTLKGDWNWALSVVFSPEAASIITSGDSGDSCPILTSHEIHVTSSPGWLVVKSGRNRSRLWLPAGILSLDYHHAFYGKSVAIGTDEGLVMILEILENAEK